MLACLMPPTWWMGTSLQVPLEDEENGPEPRKLEPKIPGFPHLNFPRVTVKPRKKVMEFERGADLIWEFFPPQFWVFFSVFLRFGW